MGLAGSVVARPDNPLSALNGNLAGLPWFEHPGFETGLGVALGDGDYTDRNGDQSDLKTAVGVLPEAALVYPLPNAPVAFGLGVTPDVALRADWTYNDLPGGLDGLTTYGRRDHLSEIVVLRTTFGVGLELHPRLSVGFGAGLLYNHNRLDAPYTFQTQPALQGAKTLLDLETDGFGLNGLVGVLFRPLDNLSLGLAYQSPSKVFSDGRASGNASAQFQSLGGAFAGLRPDFRYDAEVINEFPQIITGGLAWQPCQRLELGLQVDWINWSDAFDDLRIKLRNGNNDDLNGLTGSPDIDEDVPLDWKDRFVFRAGLEYALTEALTVRGGYAYGQSPVPDRTLTPLTAAISEHTLSAGLGFRRGRYQVDLGYQYDLPATQRVGTSSLRSGEYSGSKVETGIHWIGISFLMEFPGRPARDTGGPG